MASISFRKKFVFPVASFPVGKSGGNAFHIPASVFDGRKPLGMTMFAETSKDGFMIFESIEF